MVAHLLWEQRVAGSNPVTPTNRGHSAAVFSYEPGESMPSYRTIMTVTTLAPGRAPEEVEAAARSATRLESWTSPSPPASLVSPRALPRQTTPKPEPLHREITAAVRLVADVPRARLAAVVRGRSHYLAP